MKKNIVCSNCHTENPFFVQNCTNCNAFLRSKIANLDLWDTLWKIMESPVKTAETIIQSDHKNFAVSLVIAAAIKIGLTFYIISNAFHFFGDEISNDFNFISLASIFFLLIFIFFSFIITIVNSRFGIKNRFKDNFALYAYSLLPIILILIFLAPVQIALFGTYWFTFNPSPLIIKPMVTYVLFSIEGIFFLWSCALLITSTYSQTNSIPYSVGAGIVFSGIISVGLFFLMSLVY